MNIEQQPLADGRRSKPPWGAKSVWFAFALMVLEAFRTFITDFPRPAGASATGMLFGFRSK